MKENKLETITNLFENNTIRSIWDKKKNIILVLLMLLER